MRILIAEDEVQLAEGLKYLLDTMMPGVNGIKVLETIRSERSGIPVMMLTAKAEIEERVAGLGAGADECLPKPFSTREFIERVRALVRRNDNYTDRILSFGNIRLD
ncbi:response regulator transcription factor [Lachnospiraceae bacterium 56-18]|jgi:DNA-binding response OmpR family regulator